MEANARLIAREGQRKSEDRTASPPRGARRSRSSDPERLRIARDSADMADRLSLRTAFGRGAGKYIR